MLQVISAMVDTVRKKPRGGGGMCGKVQLLWEVGRGCEGVFAFLTQRLQRNTPKGILTGDWN